MRLSVPSSGWTIAGVVDLGEPKALCEWCQKEIIRYVHTMVQPGYTSMKVGCICAGKLSNNPEVARYLDKQARSASRKKAARLKKFMRSWKLSQKGNLYTTVGTVNIVIKETSSGYTVGWRNVLDFGYRWGASFPTAEAAKLAIFEARGY